MLISVIVPTLNEETSLEYLLRSLNNQTHVAFETIVVDGGSKDRTMKIAKKYNAKILSVQGCREFASRNIGARSAKGEILLFTCADVIFPKDTLQKLLQKFMKNSGIIAVFGPNTPYDGPVIGKVEYLVYNILRCIFAKLPKPFARFSTSTNFLAVRKKVFKEVGDFDPLDINADGILGKKLSNVGSVEFCFDTHVFISARRIREMGFLKFNFHYLYVLENFFPFLSQTMLIRNIKQRSRITHRKTREKTKGA